MVIIGIDPVLDRVVFYMYRSLERREMESLSVLWSETAESVLWSLLNILRPVPFHWTSVGDGDVKSGPINKTLRAPGVKSYLGSRQS